VEPHRGRDRGDSDLLGRPARDPCQRFF
jgi:hypothetical protein